MTAPTTKRRHHQCRAAAAMIALLPLCGCGSPSRANIELRRQNDDLSDTVAQLQRQHRADQASIRGLQDSATTLPSLPEDRLNQLFTTAGLKFGRLTGGYRPDLNRPGDTEVKIYVVPTDDQDDPIKSAGSFRVELFDLSLASNNRIGQWDFDLNTTRAHWYSGGLLYTYVLDCPWQTTPTHSKLLARVTFRDALTQRLFTVDKEVIVQPPQ
jgi:hypothetical protein